MQKETKPEDTNIDSESDLLAFYSTLPDHLSFGTIDGGTFFIQSVCDVLLNEAYKNIPNNDKLSQMILNKLFGEQCSKKILAAAENVYLFVKIPKFVMDTTNMI